MKDAGHPVATFLSLDVEGAEDKVLEAVDPTSFKVIMVEWPQGEDAKNQRVHDRLRRIDVVEARGRKAHCQAAIIV